MPSLEVTNIRKRFGSQEVLRGISFKATPGDILSIIGPSGCGKTTLLRCILGEITPDRGTIRIDGQDVTRVKVWKRGVGIVYQSYALFPHMTVAENVAYGLKVRRRPPDEIKERVRDLLELVHLTGKEDMFPERLSGGERQRVALTRALAVQPSILLLDEAFTALDATTRVKVLHEVRAIIKRFKLTTLLITHDQEEAFLFSRHVIVLNEGKVVVNGEPEHVMAHPHPFIQQFVKMALFEKAQVRRDAKTGLYVLLQDGNRIPISTPGVKDGDVVQVMVKKGTETEPQRIEVWPRENA
jgi:putative spermidine/putrescine transport system ATP-binding protein